MARGVPVVLAQQLKVRKIGHRLKEHCETLGVLRILLILVNHQRQGETEVQG